MTGEQTNSKPLEVLVIDDDPQIRSLFVDFIELIGEQLGISIAVTAAVNGKDGLEKYVARFNSKNPYHAVLTDLMMPGVNGNQVVEEVKKLTPKIPVYVVTGIEANIEYQKLKAKLGSLAPDGVIQKPVAIGIFEGIVKEIVKKSNTQAPPAYQS